MRAPLERDLEAERFRLRGAPSYERQRDRFSAAQRFCASSGVVRDEPRMRIERVTAIVRAVAPTREIHVVPHLLLPLLHAQDAAVCACKVRDVSIHRAFAVGVAVHAVV